MLYSGPSGVCSQPTVLCVFAIKSLENRCYYYTMGLILVAQEVLYRVFT